MLLSSGDDDHIQFSDSYRCHSCYYPQYKAKAPMPNRECTWRLQRGPWLVVTAKRTTMVQKRVPDNQPDEAAAAKMSMRMTNVWGKGKKAVRRDSLARVLVP
jgi:hypothetical protein